MKSVEQNKIDVFINNEIKQYLFEDVNDDMLAYFADEEKRTKTAINTANRLKGAQINPDERKIKETQIKANKDRIAKLQKMQDAIKAQQLSSSKTASTQSTMTQDTTGQVAGQITGSIVGTGGISEQAPIQPQAPAVMAPKPKRTVRVVFDKSSGKPFSVDFSERGFSIDSTRLSFETIESALSKEFNITLNQGQGLVLDQVKMQKILKYKNRF